MVNRLWQREKNDNAEPRINRKNLPEMERS